MSEVTSVQSKPKSKTAEALGLLFASLAFVLGCGAFLLLGDAQAGIFFMLMALVLKPRG